MKRILCAALLLGFAHQAGAQRMRYAPRAIDTDIPAIVGIKPSLLYARPGGPLGYWGVGNGGDWLRLGFAHARDYASTIVSRVKPDSLRGIAQPEIRQWVLDNQKFLAADIAQSEHMWVLEEKPTCAWTQSPGADGKVPTHFAIQFSYPSCRGQADSFLKAAQILIHESVHHFNGDETTADRVAIGILEAWQKGLMDLDPIDLQQAPEGAMKVASVWTGTEMITFGGFKNEANQALQNAAAYDPQTRTWRDLEAPSALTARYDAQMLWTGSEVLIWGGFRSHDGQQEWLYDGALYNPTSKQWTLLGAPTWWAPKALTWDQDPRQTLVWTGEQALIYGGIDQASQRALGAIFDPKTRSWTRLNTEAQEAPLRVGGHSAVWTGQTMIVWGGYKGSSDSSRELTAEGASYDLASNTWTPMVSQGAPSPRAGHQAVWTGQKLLVLSGGGVSSRPEITGTGGLYDPKTQVWQSFQSEIVPERVGHKAVWNGEELLVLGGRSNRLKTFFGEMYALDPATMRWRVLSSGSSPVLRAYPSLVWTGSSALVWGGLGADGQSQRSGAMYFP